MTNESDGPPGYPPAIRTVAMPADANPSGDIFGGWLMSQMDLAGGTLAHQRAKGRCVTVAVDALTFLVPVHVGDIVSCYAEIVRIGRTSLTTRIEVWAQSHQGGAQRKVTEGSFTYVALDPSRKPRVLPAEDGAG